MHKNQTSDSIGGFFLLIHQEDNEDQLKEPFFCLSANLQSSRSECLGPPSPTSPFNLEGFPHLLHRILTVAAGEVCIATHQSEPCEGKAMQARTCVWLPWQSLVLHHPSAHMHTDAQYQVRGRPHRSKCVALPRQNTLTYS